MADEFQGQFLPSGLGRQDCQAMPGCSMAGLDGQDLAVEHFRFRQTPRFLKGRSLIKDILDTDNFHRSLILSSLHRGQSIRWMILERKG